jgi:hypothetical protein
MEALAHCASAVAATGALRRAGPARVVVGLRSPMRPFFTGASLLVFFLCFKFIGTGIHALQVSGYIPSGSASYLPTLDIVGMYPTWPTTIAQLVLLGAALYVVLRDRIGGARRPSAAVLAGLLVLAVGCTSAPAPAPTPAGTPAKPAAQSAVLPAAPALNSGRKEATYVAGPRRRLEELAAALQRGDVPAARVALEAFDSEWHGIEVYVNVRSRALYGEIETHYQADITHALAEPNPDAAAIVPLVQGMVSQYDEALKLSDTGPALSPLFDDVATVRIVRAPLRLVSPALKSGDTAKASRAFGEFKAHWAEAQPLFVARSAEAQQETAAALASADKAMSATPLNPGEAGPLVDSLLERYNFGVNLLNAAARNADVSKTAFTPDDVQAAAAIGRLQQELRDSLRLWESGNRSGAGETARVAAGARFEAVAAALQARGGADAAVKKALDTYVGLAEQAG